MGFAQGIRGGDGALKLTGDKAIDKSHTIDQCFQLVAQRDVDVVVVLDDQRHGECAAPRLDLTYPLSAQRCGCIEGRGRFGLTGTGPGLA